MKKINLIVIITLLVTMLSSTVFAVQFSDLSEDHWAYEPIIEMANRGVLNGYPNGTFLPDNSITRAEFAKILVLALELKADKTEIEFQDVSENDWSYQYIQAAAKYLSAYRNDENNLIYLPNNKAVREDIAVAVVIASGHENDKYSLETLDKFSDKEEISTNLRKYVAIAVENGLMSGHANGTFEPKGYLTRAQVSKLMMNIEESKDKIVINEENNNNNSNSSSSSSTSAKKYFTDISFDSKTLKLDLGEDWDKYQFCNQKYGTYIYVPSQRYLEYQTDTVSYGKDPETGKTILDTYAYFGSNSKMTLKIMLKENSKKYTLIQLNNPFYVSKFTDEAYTENGNKYIEIVVDATNDLVKAEYQIDSGSWIEDTDAISGKKANFVIDVTKYEEGKKHKAAVRLTDKYGNVAVKSDSFSIVTEYFSDISFDSKTLKLDLGENWDKYQFCKHETYIYVPTQRYLTYQANASFYGKDPETGNSLRPSYDLFGDSSKLTLKIMLKENSKKYTLIQLNNPFYVSKFTNEAYTVNGKKHIEIVVDATNDLVKAEYQIDNGSWIENTNVINGKKASFVINVQKYEDNDTHKVAVRLTDKYGNVAVKSNDFITMPAYFSDISFDSKTLKLDLGENWDKYQFVANGEKTIYVPSQRYLTYDGGGSGKDAETGYLLSSGYWYFQSTRKEVTFKIMLKSNPQTYTTRKISNPFYVLATANEVHTKSTGGLYVEEVVNATNRLSKVEYKIDDGEWVVDTNAINGNQSDLIIDVGKYNDGDEHKINTRLTDVYGNRTGYLYYFTL